MVEPILLTTVRVLTFSDGQPLTNATGFFFENQDRIFLVTSRHVVFEPATGHFPDRIQIGLHVDPNNVCTLTNFSIPLYSRGAKVWREELDRDGTVDIAVIEIDRDAFPSPVVYHAFTPEQIPARYDQIEVGSALLVVGFPLGFHDTLHHMPIVRHATIASSFGLRFQGWPYFLTDARTHRGSSGSPVVMRSGESGVSLSSPWMLLGIHSATLDLQSRDVGEDEALGLNCAWYSDALLRLTQT